MAKLTLNEIMKRKEALLERDKAPKTANLYIKSLDAEIHVEAPSKKLVNDANDHPNGDDYLVYECVKEPNLKDKELQKEFGCVQPLDIVSKIFLPGEIPQIAVALMTLSGYAANGQNTVKEIKN